LTSSDTIQISYKCEAQISIELLKVLYHSWPLCTQADIPSRWIKLPKRSPL
jgi:hypothetical protein